MKEINMFKSKEFDEDSENVVKKTFVIFKH